MIKFTSSLFYKLTTAFCLIYTCEGFSVTSSQVFEKYPNKALIETGTFYGNGVENALKAGFKEVYSIELSPDLYQYCYEKFKSNPNVHIYLGDSSVVLKDVLAKINDPVTFWLDGHYSAGVTAKGNKNSPILEEIAAIGQHKIKNHTILIDDVRLFGTEEFDNVTKDQVIAAIKQINKDYEISFEDGYIANDVLVAKIPNASNKVLSSRP